LGKETPSVCRGVSLKAKGAKLNAHDKRSKTEIDPRRQAKGKQRGAGEEKRGIGGMKNLEELLEVETLKKVWKV
jgi:hypothetical protein